MTAQHFEHGLAYVAGFDKPFVVSLATIRDAVEAKGFEVLGVWPCEQIGGLPFAVPSGCPQQWDYMALVKRTGPSGTIEMPSRVRWVVEVPPAYQPAPGPGAPLPGMPPPAPPAPATPPASSSPAAAGGGLLAFGLAAGAAYLVLRSSRR